MKWLGGCDENAGLTVACFVLGFFLFLSGINSVPSEHFLRDDFLCVEATSFALPLSAFFSVRTVLGLVSRFLPTVGWWLRGILRWSSLGMGYGFIVVCLIGMTEPINPAMPDLWRWLRRVHSDRSPDISFMSMPVALFLVLAVGTPLILLIGHAVRDYRAARQRFGSIAQAERALSSPVPVDLWEGSRT